MQRKGGCFTNKYKNLYRIRPIALIVSVALSSYAADSFSQDYFNPDALHSDHPGVQNVSLDHFSQEGEQAPGTYRVDIYLNGEIMDVADVTFVDTDKGLKPVLTPDRLKQLGVRTSASDKLLGLAGEEKITDLGTYIPDANAKLNFGQQRLDITVPQIFMDQQARGYVDAKLWDQGINALMLNYAFTGANSHYDKKNRGEENNSTNNYYLNLRSGLNLGGWRLRNYSTYINSDNSGSQWKSINTYVQHDVERVKGQFTAGDAYTPSDVFDSVQFRGVQLASDDNMQPDSLRGFAPVVRGIAQSNAQVTIRQNGYVIYQTYVTPGAFAISDLYPTSSSGNLEVTVKEASGQERKFIQPYSAVPIMQREGRLKYGVSVGKYRSLLNGAREPNFTQASLIYGLPGDTSVYAGQISSKDYLSFLLGVGHGFGDLGSLSFDVTEARTRLEHEGNHQGQSLRFQYSKDIAESGTSFTLAGYRYSTSGYYDFTESNELEATKGEAWRVNYNKRSRVQLNVSQSIGDAGNIYISGYQQDFWRQSGYERNLGAGYNFGHDGINYSLSYSYTQAPSGDGNDQIFSFAVQIPLSKWLPNSWATSTTNVDKHGKAEQSVGLSGTALADNNLSYNVQQSYGNRGAGASGLASASYKSTYGEVNAGYNYNKYSQQINYGLQGGLLVHPYGVTLSQALGETLSLVRAPGAAGVHVQNNTGVYTDWRGYTVVPYVTTYRKNRIAIDTETLAEDVDIDTNTRTVIPTQGAVVLADFQTRLGSRIMLTLKHDGGNIPFGAMVSLIAPEDSASSGIVDANSQVYLSGMPEKSKLKVIWGEGESQRCIADIVLPTEKENASSVQRLTATCK